MSLDADAVARIARLARIRVTEDEKINLAAELSQVLGWIDALREVDTGGVEPMTSVVGQRLTLRPDIIDQSADRDAILANSPDSMSGFFTVPKVVE